MGACDAERALCWCPQEYKERSARIAQLREDFGREDEVLQAATAALNEKRVRQHGLLRPVLRGIICAWAASLSMPCKISYQNCRCRNWSCVGPGSAVCVR